MLYNTFLAATGGAGYSSCNKMISKSFYQETVLSLRWAVRICHPEPAKDLILVLAEQVAIATCSCGIAAKLHKNGSF